MRYIEIIDVNWKLLKQMNDMNDFNNKGGMYMNTLVGWFELLFFGLAILQVFKWILFRTYFGKSLRLCFRIIRTFFKWNYESLEKISKVLNSKLQERQKYQKPLPKKEAAYGKVVNLKEYTKPREES
jgi:hypothetical protein